MSKKKRMIIHVDMDHFFTAVEEREHPEFKDKPDCWSRSKGRKGKRGCQHIHIILNNQEIYNKTYEMDE